MARRLCLVSGELLKEEFSFYLRMLLMELMEVMCLR